MGDCDESSVATGSADLLEELDRATSLQMFTTLDVGRIAWADADRVVVLPLNFAFDGDDIVVRTASASMCAAVNAGRRFSFQGDDFEPSIRIGWTVLLNVTAEEETDSAEVERLSSLVSTWRGSAELRSFRLRIKGVAGRRLRSQPGHVSTVFMEP